MLRVHGEFHRYFLSCLMALLLDYGITAGGIWLGAGQYLALLAGVAVGAVTGFLLLSFWVFPTQESGFSLRRMGGYLAGVGLVYVIRACCVWVWSRLGFGPEMIYVGLFFAYGCSFIGNFIFQKYVVFRGGGAGAKQV